MDVAGNMVAKNALLPLISKVMGTVAVVFAASFTMNSVVYAPWPPICELVTAPVLAFNDIPSGNGAKLPLASIENV
jgi:hypothetical protein